MNRLLAILVTSLLLSSCARSEAPNDKQNAPNDKQNAPKVKPEIKLPPRLTMTDAKTVLSPSKLGQRGPAVAYGDGVYLLVWQEGFCGLDGKSSILGQLLDSQGRPIHAVPIQIAGGAGLRDSPAAAYCPAAKKFLVAWSDLSTGRRYNVRWATVDRDGRVAPKDGVAIPDDAARANPAVASNGADQFLIVYQEAHGEHFGIDACLCPVEKGAVLQGGRFAVMDRGERPAVAWTGSAYFVSQKWYGAMLAPDGKVKVPTTQMWTDKQSGCSTAAAAWGKGFLFVNCVPFPDPWGWSGNGSICGATMTAAGTGPENALAVGLRSRRGGMSEPLSAAKADGRVASCLDAARWFNHPGWPMGMRGGMKHMMGDVWPSGQTAAAYNGRSLLVVWPRAGMVDNRRLADRDLYLARVLPDWGVVDRPPVCLVAGGTEEANPVLAGGPPGGCLLAYEKVTPAGPVVEYRIITEAEDLDPPKVRYVVPASADADTQWIVAFDEPIDAASVKPASFRIAPEPRAEARGSATTEPAVKSAALNPDARGGQHEVVLTLAGPLARGQGYTLTALGVKDRSPAGNAARGVPFTFLAQPGAMLRTDYIDRWTVLGPLPRDAKNHPFDPAAGLTPSPGDAVKAADKTLTWKQVPGQAIDLGSVFNEDPQQMAYAATYVYSDRGRQVVLRIDTNDHNRVWLNGRRVHDDITGATGSRGFHDSADEVPIKLDAGWNRLLVQVDNWLTTWMMSAQIVEGVSRAGQPAEPVRDLTWQAAKPADPAGR